MTGSEKSFTLYSFTSTAGGYQFTACGYDSNLTSNPGGPLNFISQTALYAKNDGVGKTGLGIKD